MSRRLYGVCLALTVFLISNGVQAQEQGKQASPTPAPANAKPTSTDEDLDLHAFSSLNLEKLLEMRVSTASKEEETLRESPSTVSVFTRKDFLALGVRTLDDLLMFVPGFDVRPESQIDVRGISSASNNRILIMVDGVPMNDAFSGGTGKTSQLLQLEYVERVEVIRGPGSALYGTNAFAAVVSVTTLSKALDSLDSPLVLSGGAGTHAAEQGTAITSQEWDAFRLSSYVDGRRSGGPTYNLHPKDLGRSGNITQNYQDLSAGLSLAYEESAQLSANYFRRKRSGLISTDNTLMPDSGYTSDWLGLNLALQHNFDGVELHSNLFGIWDHFGNADLMISPPRVNDLAPNGLYDHPSYEMWRGGTDTYAHYKLGAQSFMLGGLAEVVAMPESAAIPATNGRDGPPAGFGGVFMPAKTRRILGAYVQYRWAPTSAFQLTAGGRADHYSDFGLTVNPRLALISIPWDWFYAKAIAGSAFRAPAFRECCVNPNDYTVGNSNLAPERVSSLEGVVGTRPFAGTDLHVSVFKNRVTDMILSAPIIAGNRVVYENVQGFDTWGTEAELSAKVAAAMTLHANYTYINGTTHTGGVEAPLPWIAHHMGTLLLQSDFFNHLQFTPSIQYRGARLRQQTTNDPRPEVKPSYFLNANLRGYDLLTPGLELSLLFSNVLGQPRLGPSNYPGRNPLAQPADIPGPGFEMFATVRYTFL